MNSDVTEVRLTMWRQSAYAQDLVCSHIDEQIGNAFKNVTIERKYKLHANVCTRKRANKFPAHYRVPAQYIYGNEMDRPDRLGIINSAFKGFSTKNIILLGFNSSLSILHISILLGERVIKRAQSPSTPNNGGNWCLTPLRSQFRKGWRKKGSGHKSSGPAATTSICRRAKSEGLLRNV